MYHASPLLPMKDDGIMETALQALNTVGDRTSIYPPHSFVNPLMFINSTASACVLGTVHVHHTVELSPFNDHGCCLLHPLVNSCGCNG